MSVAGDLRGAGGPRGLQRRHRSQSQDRRYGRSVQGQDLRHDRASDAGADRGQQGEMGLDRGLKPQRSTNLNPSNSYARPILQLGGTAMDFGIICFTSVESRKDVAFAERNGFTHAWLADTQMI